MITILTMLRATTGAETDGKCRFRARHVFLPLVVFVAAEGPTTSQKKMVQVVHMVHMVPTVQACTSHAAAYHYS